MAKVYFKRGHLTALDALQSYVEGSFYLTDDTNRLYFAQSSSNLVDLNQYIHFVATRAGLPTSSNATLKDGDIYYIQGENILCIYQVNDPDGPWVQINPDTYIVDDNDIVSVQTANGETVVATTVVDSHEHTATGDFSLVGGDNVHISSSGTTITISADNDQSNTTYELQTVSQTGKGQIKLHNTSSVNSPDSVIDIEGDEANVFVTATPASGNNNAKITITGNAGITDITDGFSTTGQYVIALSRTSGGDIETDGVTPIIQIGHATASQATAVFASGTAVLDVYTAAEVDTLLENNLRTLDAMHYDGTVTNANASTKLVLAPRYGIGTVYMAGADLDATTEAGHIVAKAGDLLIASGTNDSAVTWEVVESGNDQVLSVVGNSASKTVSFTDSVTNDSVVGVISIDGGRKNSVTANAAIEVSVDVDNNATETFFTIVHGDPGVGTAVTAATASGAYIQSAGTSGSPSTITVPIITGLSKDAQGHITSVTAQEYTFTDTHATLQSIETSVAASNNTASVGSSIQLDGATPQEIEFSLTSNNLSVTATNADTIVVDLEWGTFS